jgi:PAS domain S-box-containing protein
MQIIGQTSKVCILLISLRHLAYPGQPLKPSDSESRKTFWQSRPDYRKRFPGRTAWWINFRTWPVFTKKDLLSGKVQPGPCFYLYNQFQPCHPVSDRDKVCMNMEEDNPQESGEEISRLAAENKALRAEHARLQSAHQAATEKLEARLAVEEALKESQTRFQTIFEQSSIGNKIITSDLRIVRVNHALTEMTGYSKTRLEGTRITDFTHPDYVEHWRELQQSLWTKQIPSFGIETVLVREDGSFLWCRVTSILFRDGKETLGYTLLEDISMRREWETLRRQQSLLLMQGVVQAQEEERSRIAESLHNGEGQILYATQLHLARVKPAGPVQKPDEHQALEKTRELLSQAIREIRHVSIELVPVLLKEFGLRKAITELCSRFAGTGIRLSCLCFEERLPPVLETAVYRIAQELVTNIVRHSGASNGWLDLHLDKDYVYLEARDNGKGMAASSEADIRHPGPDEGTGLPAMQGRVALLEGTLDTESAPGKGTLITIRLPLPATG